MAAARVWLFVGAVATESTRSNAEFRWRSSVGAGGERQRDRTRWTIMHVGEETEFFVGRVGRAEALRSGGKILCGRQWTLFQPRQRGVCVGFFFDIDMNIELSLIHI